MIATHRCADNPRLFPLPQNSLPDDLRDRINPISRRNPAALSEIARTWPAFVAAVGSIEDELLREDFAVIHSLYQRLAGAGVRFGRAFIDYMDELRRELRGSAEDSDDDACVCDSEKDDPDEDHYDEIYVNEGYDDAFEGSDDAFEGDDSDLTEDEQGVDEHHEQHHMRCVHNFPDTPEPTGLIHIGKDVKISRISDTIRLRRAASPVRQRQHRRPNRAPEPIRLKRRKLEVSR